NTASKIAARECVRKKLVDLQREMAKKTSVVMDGRDIGTVVLPDAKYKFFLTASVEVRALRRFKELNQNSNISIEEVTEDIIKRDYNDMNREIAPLKQADDSILIDSSNLSIDETVDKIVSYVDRR
ncbi:MAG TPA: (d)CMP kinase, partial [Tissierellaceae bacterium]